MQHLFQWIFQNGFPVFIIGASLITLFLIWKIRRVDDPKKRSPSLLLSIIAISFILVALAQIEAIPVVAPLIQKRGTESSSTFGRDDTVKKVDCTTSNATGSTAAKLFPVRELIGDGETDSYPAIQQAINTAGNAGGGIVQLPEGTFLINGHIAMRNNVTLSGAGPKTIIKAGPKFLQNSRDLSYSIVFTKGVSNVTLRNFTADHQGNVLDGKSIDRFMGFVIYVLDSKNVLVHDVYVRNPFAFSMMVENTSQFCLYNNDTQIGTNGKYNQVDGIHVLNSSFGDVRNNYIDQGFNGMGDGDDGLAAHTIDGITHDVTFAHNTVRGGKGGAGMQLALTNQDDAIFNIKIQNNEFWGSPRGIRTGYYGKPGGSVHDIVIGGSPETGNYIHDNIFNNTTKEDVVNIYGDGTDPYNITVSHNRYCKAGIIAVGKGMNNVVSDNKECE